MRKIPAAVAFCVMSASGAVTLAQTSGPQNEPGAQQGGDPAIQQSRGDGPGPEMRNGRAAPAYRIQRRLDRMTRYLELSDEQKTQVEAIMEMQQAESTALRQETNRRIADVLNDQQRAKFADMRDRRGKGGPGGRKDCRTGQKSGRSS